MKTALTIAGSDPTGGAGVQADLKVFRHFGVYGLSAVSALTAQNTVGVAAVEAVSAAFLEAQLTTLFNDLRPDALKTGMLFSRASVAVVIKMIKAYDLQNVVVDTVIRSSSGASLMAEDALALYKSELLSLAAVITPNIGEAAALTGMPVTSEKEMEAAARELKRLGPEVVVVTGGHLDNEALDVVYDGAAVHRLRAKKIQGEYHGTGCAFSAAVTALLAKGTPALDAVGTAKEFMHAALSNASTLGRGMRLLHV